jgi:cell wall-associated NlpC family hydrolase
VRRRALAFLLLLGACASQTSVVEFEQRLQRIVQPWIGTPYRRGGSSLRGTDCSGFTRSVMEELGVELPRRSRDQALAGTPIAREDLRAGDLVFFDLRKGRSGIDHVGLYTGDGLFVHASPRRGVAIDRLDEQIFRRSYRGARRVLD